MTSPLYMYNLLFSDHSAVQSDTASTLSTIYLQVFPGSARAGNVTLVDHSVTYQFRVSAATIESGDINEGELSAITINTTLFVPKPGAYFVKYIYIYLRIETPYNNYEKRVAKFMYFMPFFRNPYSN